MKYIFSLIYIACLTIPAVLLFGGLWFGWRKLFLRAKRHPSWWLQSILLVYPVCWVVLLLVQRLAPQRDGLLAVSHIFIPHLFLPLVLLVPFAFLPRTLVLRIALIGCIGVFILVFLLPLRYTSPRDASAEQTISILNWNVERTELPDQRQRLRELLLRKSADIVVLEETYWQWLRADADIVAVYPHQFVHSMHSESGLVLLTRYPVSAFAVSDLAQNGQGWARFLWIRLTIDQQSLMVLALHPEAPFGTSRSCQFIPCFDPTNRDKLFVHARTIIEPVLARNEALVVVGDLNVTEREAIYPSLTAGLQDAHSQIGIGFGTTWGLLPQFLWSVPILRIDHMLTSPTIVPVQFTTDCQLRGSDHCIIKGTFVLRPIE